MSLSVTKKRSLAALAAACLASVALPATPALAQKVKNKTPAAEASASSVDYVVTIPSVEAVQSSMDEATITDILSGNLAGNAAALAELDATSITIPEITVTLDVEVDGETVSSALLIPSTHDIAVVEHVHTLPAYRRRGYGRWLMRALHAEAVRLGQHQIVLGSNDAGRPLYTALGYVPLCSQDVYLVGQ